MTVIGFEIHGGFLDRKEAFAGDTIEEARELAEARRKQIINELMEDKDGLVFDLERDNLDPLTEISNDIKITETMVSYDSLEDVEDYYDVN